MPPSLENADAVPVTEARDEFAELVNRAAYAHDRVRLTRHGRVVAALISAEDLAFFEALEADNELRAYRSAKAEDDGTRIEWSDAAR